MTLTAMMIYSSMFLKPSTYFGYDDDSSKSKMKAEIDEIKRQQQEEKELADLQLKRTKNTHAGIV